MSSNDQYNFKREPDDSLKCLICLEVASNPVQHSCGRLFCKECIAQYGNNPCPNCRKESPKYFPDARGKLASDVVFLVDCIIIALLLAEK